jgi:hypothetical protein
VRIAFKPLVCLQRALLHQNMAAMKDKLHEGAVRRLRETQMGLRIAEKAKKEKDRSVELAPRYKYRSNVKERRQSVIQDQVNKSHVTSIIHSMPKDLEYISDERIAQEHKVLVGDLLAAKETQQAPNLPAEYKSDSALEGVLDTTNDSILPLDWVRNDAMAISSSAAESDQYPRSVGKRLSGELTAGALESVRGSRSARRRAGLNKSAKNKGRGLGLLAQFIPPSDDQEAVNTSLAECLMLVGPSPANVLAVVEQAASPFNQASDALVGMVSLEPEKLYMTDMAAHGGDGMEMDALPSFCFPVGIHTHATPPQSRRSSSRITEPRHSHRASGAMGTVISPQMDARFFTFVLSGHTTSQYGVCMRIGRTVNLEPRPGVIVSVDTQYCICLVTKYPFFSYIFHVMKAFDDMGGFHLDDELIERQEPGFPIQRCLRFLNDFALKLRHYVVPKPSNYLNLSFSVHHKRYEAKFYRNLHRSRDVEISRQILFWGLPILLKFMSVRDVVSAIGYTLTEMRLVVVSADPTVLSACTLALVHLLRPVRWVGPMIITLPHHLLAYLESPVPVVVGLAELPDGFEVTTDMTLVDPMLSQLELHPDDVIRSHELSMPASHDLVKQLKPLAKDIVDQWETSGSTPLREPSEMVSSFEEGVNLGDKPADWAPILALDLGWDTAAGQKYCKTVTHFVDIVYKHIESILNLAIEFTSTDSSGRRVHRQRAKQEANDSSQDDMSKNLSPDLDLSNVMSRESLTDSNVSFINHLRDTQMFSQFDHFSSQGMTMSGRFSRKKSYSELESDLNKPFANSSEGGDDDYRTSVSVTSIVSVENSDMADGSGRGSTPKGSFTSPSRVEWERRAGRDNDDSDDGRQAALKAERLHGLRDNEDDPMIQLFAILLTGTVQLRRDPLLSGLMREVADTADKDKDRNRRENPGRRTRGGRTVIYRKSDAGGVLGGGGDGAEAGNNVAQDVVEDITWCNGRCYGRADTPTCTNICVAVWQGRVMWMKHQQFLKDMAEKRVEPPGVARPETLYKPDYSKTLKKHLNETETQFKLRVQIRDSADGRSKRPPPPQRTKHKGVLRTMRRYYAKKFTRRWKYTVLNALRVLKRFVLFIENGGCSGASNGADAQGQLSPTFLSDDENGVGVAISNTSNTSASTERDGVARSAVRESGGSDMSILEAHRAFMKIGSSTSKDSLDLNMNGAFRGQNDTPSSQGSVIEGITALHSFNWLAHGAWPCSMGPREQAQLDQLDLLCQDKVRAFVDDFVGRCVRPLTDMNSMEAEGRESPLGRLHTLSEGPHTALDPAAVGDGDDTTQQGQGRPPEGKIERSSSLSSSVVIVALGDGAAEHLTPQQQQAVMKLHDRLCKGVQVRKHGLTGKPRVRYLYCSDDMTRLFWRSEKVQSNDAVSRVNLGFAGKQDAARELFMSEMKEVCDDLSTVAMQRSLSKGYVTKKPNVRGVFAPGCISIILANRTMDFEAEMNDWETLYHAFKILVNLYQNILPNLKR